MAGNIPKFTSFDVLRCLWLIAEQAEQGKETARAALVERLGLGEGTVKSILALLKEKNLAESSQQGHQVTEEGKKYLERLDGLFLRPKRVDNDAIDESMMSIATCISSPDPAARLDFSLRDEAVKAGADGALFYQYVSNSNAQTGHFEMPAMGRDERVIATAEKMMKAFPAFTPKHGCVLLVSFATDERNAMWGLLAMVRSVIPPKQDVVPGFLA